MHGHVASLPDVLRFPPDNLGHELAEGGPGQVAIQVLDPRRAQGLVHFVDPLDQVLQCVAGMKAGGARVAVDSPLGKTRALRRMGELLLQKREVLGDFHRNSEVASEGAGLQGGEEGFEFGQVCALEGLLLLDRFDDGGEAVLEVKRRQGDGKLLQKTCI